MSSLLRPPGLLPGSRVFVYELLLVVVRCQDLADLRSERALQQTTQQAQAMNVLLNWEYALWSFILMHTDTTTLSQSSQT